MKKLLSLALSILLTLTGCSAETDDTSKQTTEIQEETMNKTDFVNILPTIVGNSIRMNITEGAPASPLSSRYGGSPMLPAGFEWPYYEGTTWDEITANRPLAFLGQINLSETAPYDTDKLLPDHGMLAIFYDLTTQKWGYDPADKGCVRVYWFENADKLVETTPPDDVCDFNGEPITIPQYTITFTSEKSVPSMDEYESDYNFWTDGMYEAYKSEAEKLGAAIGEEDPSNIHKLLGYANAIQGDIRHDCAFVPLGYYLGNSEYRNALSDEKYAEISSHKDDWVLLCQIGTIGGYPDFELMWGDMGCVYICIRRDDLAARNFDNVWIVLQCG